MKKANRFIVIQTKTIGFLHLPVSSLMNGIFSFHLQIEFPHFFRMG